MEVLPMVSYDQGCRWNAKEAHWLQEMRRLQEGCVDATSCQLDPAQYEQKRDGMFANPHEGLAKCHEADAQKRDDELANPHAGFAKLHEADEQHTDGVFANPQEGFANGHEMEEQLHVSSPKFDLVGKKYNGRVWHSSWDYENYSIHVEITSSTAGKWMCMDQTLDISVSLQDDQLTLDDGETKLVGQINDFGNISGKTIQDGSDGRGTFRLSPECHGKPGNYLVHLSKSLTHQKVQPKAIADPIVFSAECPWWKDSLHIHKHGRFNCVSAHGEGGSWLLSNGSLILKWKRWSQEYLRTADQGQSFVGNSLFLRKVSGCWSDFFEAEELVRKTCKAEAKQQSPEPVEEPPGTTEQMPSKVTEKAKRQMQSKVTPEPQVAAKLQPIGNIIHTEARNDEFEVSQGTTSEYLTDVAPSLYSARPAQTLLVDRKFAMTITLGQDVPNWHLWEPSAGCQHQESPAKQACGTYFAVRDADSGDFNVDVCQLLADEKSRRTYHGTKACPLLVRLGKDSTRVTLLSYCKSIDDEPNLIPYDAWRVIDGKGDWLIENARNLKQGPWIARTSIAEETDFRIVIKKDVVPQFDPPALLCQPAPFAGQAVQCHVVHMKGERNADRAILCRRLKRIVDCGGPNIQVHMHPAWDTRGLNEAEVSSLQQRGVVSQEVFWEKGALILGCALSHSDIWLKRAQSNDEAPWIILEDDAELNTGRNIVHLLGESLQALSQAPWDIVLLGAWSQKNQAEGAWVNCCNIGPITEFCGTWAYAITQRGAQRALAAVWASQNSTAVNGRGLGVGLDIQMANAARARQLNILLCMPQALLHPSTCNYRRWNFKGLDYEFSIRDKLDDQGIRHLTSHAFTNWSIRWPMIDDIADQVSEYRRAGRCESKA